MKYDSILDTIGQTPLVRIDPAVHGLRSTELYAKLEFFNPFGSVKDRAAWGMARPALADAAERGAEVVELSSGNTAKALAVIASMHGLGFRSVTNRMKIPEVKELLLLLGAEIEELPGQSECLDPTDTEDPLTRFHRELSAPGGSFLHTDQYFNPANARAHEEGTGPEIIADLGGRAPDWFVAGVGTAGSSSGVARALRAVDGEVRVLGLVAEKSDFVPGIRNLDEVQEVGLFDPATYDLIEAVGSLDAIDGMVELIRRCGILAGPTGGAAYHGAVRRLREVEASEPERRRTAVFVVCDRVESYLSYVRARRPELLGATASLATRTAASVGEEERAGVNRMPVAEAQKWLLHEQPLVVDLRGPHAYAAQHIEGSVNIADELFAELLRGGLPFSKSRPVLLACPVGEKSVGYAAVLTRMGHPDVRSLDGGVIAWRDAGAPLVRE
ncbi:cysteine synthase B [Streptomyces sp. SPB78]|uniref:pyridoxal-phosphate dependent enzyme n=1 Tax=Streptomyces sp. (strain SPB78) TaxID=591157 RepID=UPI0001B579BE|nr:pyridoxal-phosphate dependent enzyme [Streptomyces sp. SPB78]EFL04020.1 cysteine synthase B [Streptomyces sp. SPB78]